jgi:hypothetical protein
MASASACPPASPAPSAWDEVRSGPADQAPDVGEALRPVGVVRGAGCLRRSVFYWYSHHLSA